MILDEANLVNINVTKNETRKGNCVFRALASAFQVDYAQMVDRVYRMFETEFRPPRYHDDKKEDRWYSIKHAADKGATESQDWIFYNSRFDYLEKALSSLGLTLEHDCKGLTLNDFADQHTSGSYFVVMYPQKEMRNGHAAAVVNGEIIDTWDCRDYTIEYYCKVKDSALHVSRNTGLYDWVDLQFNEDDSAKPGTFMEEFASRFDGKTLFYGGITYTNVSICVYYYIHSSKGWGNRLKVIVPVKEQDGEDEYIAAFNKAFDLIQANYNKNLKQQLKDLETGIDMSSIRFNKGYEPIDNTVTCHIQYTVGDNPLVIKKKVIVDAADVVIYRREDKNTIFSLGINAKDKYCYACDILNECIEYYAEDNLTTKQAFIPTLKKKVKDYLQKVGGTPYSGQ